MHPNTIKPFINMMLFSMMKTNFIYNVTEFMLKMSFNSFHIVN